MGWMVYATPRPLYPPERPGTLCTGGWVGPGPVWTGAENLAHTGIRYPDRPARSELLYGMRYPGLQEYANIRVILNLNFKNENVRVLSPVVGCSESHRKSERVLRLFSETKGP